jgi:hypothetical protein
MLRQSVKPSTDYFSNTFRNADSRRATDTPLHKVPLIGQQPDYLVQEERVALRVGIKGVSQIIGYLNAGGCFDERPSVLLI